MLAEESLQEQHLRKMFDALWGGLEQKINPILEKSKRSTKEKPKQERESSEILEDILTHSRQSTQILIGGDRSEQINYIKQIHFMLEQMLSSRVRVNSDAVLYIAKRWIMLYDELGKFLNGGLLIGPEQASIRQNLEKFNSTILDISRDHENTIIGAMDRYPRTRKGVFD